MEPLIAPDPVLIQWYDDHYYKVVKEGVTYYLPSVTTKLGIIHKEGLDRWRGDLGNREADLIMNDASARGKRIHWAWETALNGGCVVFNPWQGPIYTKEQIEALNAKYEGRMAILTNQDEMWQLTKLRMAFNILKPVVLDVEMKVYDIENRDAGTIDGVYFINEGEYAIAGATPLYLEAGVWIVDLKSGKYLDDNVWLQLAPYAKMYQNAHGMKVAGALVFHTGAKTKKGIPGFTTLKRTAKELDKDYSDYRHVVALWEREHGDDKPVLFDFPSLIDLKGEKPS